MDDLISRRAAIDALMERFKRVPTNAIIAKDVISKLPSAQPERKNARWIPVINGRGGHECSRCHNYAPSYKNGDEYLANYCPNCGAYMKGKPNE